MEIGFIGLGRMGGNMVRRILGHSEYQVVAFDVRADARSEVEAAGAQAASTLEEVVARLPAPRVVWLMLPPGAPTGETVEALLDLFTAGDVIADGGNSKWSDSVARHARCADRGVHFVDVGTSGGIWGRELGYCLMVGGEQAPVERLVPIFESLAAADGWAWLGGPGAGHFVKMIHNGIEYGLMQAYAEGFELAHRSEFGLDVERITNLWNHGSVVRSWLLELAARAFGADGNDLEHIAGHVEDSGQGRWMLAAAIDRNVPVPALTAAVYARFASRGNGDHAARLCAALRQQFGGHAVSSSDALGSGSG